MKRRITLKDMALRLGLSVSGISKALHNDPRISVTQKKRVLRLAKSLGYRPDPGLIALAAYRLKSGIRPTFASLAFVGFKPYGQDWTASFFDGAKRQAEELGYQINYYWLSPHLSLQRHARILHSQGVRGLILAPLPDGITTVEFDWSLFSVVVVGRSLVHPELHRTSPDTFGALLRAVENVRRLNYERIGIAVTREQDARVGWRWTGATAVAQQRLRLSSQRILLFQDSETKPSHFLSWLKREKPEVVISLTHPMHDWIRATGFRIPRDFALVSLNLHENLHEDTKIAGIDQNFEMVGASAMTLLHSNLIRGETGIPQSRLTQLVQSSWVEGPLTSRHAMPSKKQGMDDGRL